MVKWLDECHHHLGSVREGTIKQLCLLSVIDTYSVEVPSLTVCQHERLDAPRVGLSFHVLAKGYPPLIGDDRLINRYLLGLCESCFKCRADAIQKGLDFPPLCDAVDVSHMQGSKNLKEAVLREDGAKEW